MTSIVIDAREMLPPEPLMRALAALDELQDNDELTLLLHKRPHPLFPILTRTGYRWNELEEDGGGYKYRIFRR